MKHEEFSEVIQPVIDWMKKNCNPHQTVIIEYDHARVVSDDIGVPVEVE